MPKLPTPPVRPEEPLFDAPEGAAAPPTRGIPADDEIMPLPSEDFDIVRPGRSPAFKAAVAIAALAVIAGGLLAYRAHHRRQLVEIGLAGASKLMRLDTAAGYRDAASLLEPLAQIDPLEAGSARALALAMLFADYRDEAAEGEAEALLVEPGRADHIPARANLAAAALGLGRGAAGEVATAAGRASGDPLSGVLIARTALIAGNPDAALEPASTAAAADPRLPAALALHGDLLRRLRKDPAGAHTAYAAALAASPLHPRAAYGLAKLALAAKAPAAEARAALQRILADSGTPSNERGRAALHLAALSLAAGDRSEAGAALDAAGLDAPSRAWAERAAAFAAAGGGTYRALEGAPASLVSASDDEPTLAPPPPLPPSAKHAAKMHPGKIGKKSSAPSAKAGAKKAGAKKVAAKKKKAT